MKETPPERLVMASGGPVALAGKMAISSSKNLSLLAHSLQWFVYSRRTDLPEQVVTAITAESATMCMDVAAIVQWLRQLKPEYFTDLIHVLASCPHEYFGTLEGYELQRHLLGSMSE
jgi:hypothetical protein